MQFFTWTLCEIETLSDKYKYRQGTAQTIQSSFLVQERIKCNSFRSHRAQYVLE